MSTDRSDKAGHEIGNTKFSTSTLTDIPFKKYQSNQTSECTLMLGDNVWDLSLLYKLFDETQFSPEQPKAAGPPWVAVVTGRKRRSVQPVQPSKEFVRNRGNLFLAQSIKEGGLSDEDLANQRLNDIISPRRFVWVTLRACDWTKRQGPWVKRYK